VIDLLRFRYLYLLISGLIIVPGLIFMALGGLKPGIDFTGGSELTVVLPPRVSTSANAVESIVKSVPYNGKATLDETQAQRVLDDRSYPGQQEYIIRTRDIGARTDVQQNILTKLGAAYNTKTGSVKSIGFFTVGSTVGSDTTSRAALAVFFAAVAILLYMAFAFRKLRHPFVYGGAAIAALLHDVLVVLGLFAIMGYFFNVRIDALFVPAVLTVIGFSVHDTIVVFDRIRENLGRRSGEPYYTVVNQSLAQTLGRSLNTSLTVLLTLTALLLFGGESIRVFVLALLIGIASGTYSSIFNATPLAVIWETGEWRDFFGRGKRGAPGARAMASRGAGTAR